MNEVFKTGAVFDLAGNFSPELQKFISGLEKLDKAIQGSQTELKKFGFGNLAARTDKQLEALVKATTAAVDKVIADFSRIDKAVDGTMSAVAKLGASVSTDLEASSKFGADGVIGNLANVDKAIGGSMGEVAKLAGTLSGDLTSASSSAATDLVASFGRVDSAIATSTASVGTLKAEIATAVAALNGVRIPQLPGSGSGGAGGRGGGGGGEGGHGPRHGPGHRGFHFRAHGVSIPGGHVGAAEGSSGIVPAIGAYAAGETVAAAIEHGFDFDHWVSQFRAAGFNDEQIDTAKRAAWANAGQNPNASATDSLKNILELNKATGNLDESIGLLPAFSTAEMAMQSVKAENLHSRFNGGTQILNFAKGLEEMGVTQKGDTEQERTANVNLYTKELLRTMISSRGLFDGNALFAMTNNSGGAAQNWDMRMGTVVAPILGDIMKHSKLGNADYMALKTYSGGGLTSKAVEGLIKYGLVDEDLKSGKVWQDAKKQWHLEANSKFAEGASENLFDWSGKKLAELEAHGVNTHDQKAMNAIINEIGSNKSTTMMMRALLEPGTRAQIVKEMALRDNVPENAAGVLQQSDPVLKIDALHKKWDDFLTALGGPMTDVAIKALTNLAMGLNSLAQAMEAHPEATKNIAIALTGVAFGLATLAAVAFTVFLPAGAAVVGIGALAGALTAFAAVNWTAFQKGGAIDSALTSFFTGLVGFFTDLIAKLRAIPVLGQLLSGGGPSANPSGAPLTETQKSWMLQHPDQGIPDDLAPSALRDYRKRAEAAGPNLPSGFHPADDDRTSRARSADADAWKQQQDMIRATSQQFGSLNTTTGVVLTSFDGLDKGAVAVNDNFTSLGTGSAGFKNALDILTATAIGAARALAQVALAGGFGAGGGNGIINASWGGGGIGGGGGGSWNGNALAVGGGFGNGSWAQSGATRPEVADYIRAKAAELGIDPNVALRVSQSEGFNTYTGDYGTSFGPYQLHYGGSGIRGMNSGGLGDAFTRATGLDARDPKTWKAQVDFALRNAKRDGWGAWHGAAHVGIGSRQGLDYHGPVPTAGPPPKKSTPGSPASDKPMVSAQNDAPQHHHIYLDGKKIAQVVTKHQVAARRFPTSVGFADGHGSYINPAGTPVTDAA